MSGSSRGCAKNKVAFESLDNGFLSCERPTRLQQLCGQLGPVDVQSFFEYWSKKLPWPLTVQDREVGFEHRLSLWQVEASLTQVFDRPVQGRHLFEEVTRHNLDLGRPDRDGLGTTLRVMRRTRARMC